MSDDLAASVLIATYRSPDSLMRVVNAVLLQLRDDDELVVVDDGSGDETPAVLDTIEDPRVRAIIQDNGGVSAARNGAAAVARNPLLVFLDDDEVPQPRWLEVHRASHASPKRVVMGQAELLVPSGLGTKVLPVAPSIGIDAPAVLVNDSFSVRRGDFEAVGGFDARFVHGGEDIDLGLRLTKAGLELHVASEAVVRHEIDRTYREFRQQRLRRGRASLLLEELHGVGLVPQRQELRGGDRLWVLASRWKVIAEGSCMLLWGLVRLAGFGGRWRVQAAAASRITLVFGLVGRTEGQRKGDHSSHIPPTRRASRF